MPNKYDDNFLNLLKAGNQSAFKQLFDQNFLALCQHLYRIVPDNQLSEDIAQEVFIQFWNKRDSIQIHSSIIGFLKISGRNKLLNHLRIKNIKWDDLEPNLTIVSNESNAHDNMEYVEFETKVHQIIDLLPPRCRTIFALSRFEELTYRQIADNLGISVKTVENQMSKALKFLRNQIHNGDYKKV